MPQSTKNTKNILGNIKIKPRLWKGPTEDGITYSMLCRFLNCRERFKLYAIEGLRSIDTFNHKIEFGQLWHTCEEALAKGNDPTRGGRHDRKSPLWEDALLEHARRLVKQYVLDQAQIDHWYNVVKVTFPEYVNYWEQHPDVLQRKPLLQEKVFNVPYQLPSGRTVRLRGKWDSVDLIKGDNQTGIYLQENKTKGDIDENKIKRQLTYDLQTMMYLVALRYEKSTVWDCDAYDAPPGQHHQVLGVRYNVVRRPLSGGKGTIVRHKPTKKNPLGESKEDYYARLATYIKESPETYFMRWKCEVSNTDIDNFRRDCLNPILENLCNWWHGVTSKCYDQFALDCLLFGQHWRHPFGVYNTLDGSTELDYYLETGSTAGLQIVSSLFKELE